MSGFLIPKFLRKKNKPFKVSIGNNEPVGELNVYSGTWAFIDKFANEEIERLRKKNDSPLLDPIKTAIIRGKIKVLKQIIDLPKENTKGILR